VHGCSMHPGARRVQSGARVHWHADESRVPSSSPAARNFVSTLPQERLARPRWHPGEVSRARRVPRASTAQQSACGTSRSASVAVQCGYVAPQRVGHPFALPAFTARTAMFWCRALQNPAVAPACRRRQAQLTRGVGSYFALHPAFRGAGSWRRGNPSRPATRAPIPGVCTCGCAALTGALEPAHRTAISVAPCVRGAVVRFGRRSPPHGGR
jgi:hypothetical protein